MQDRSDAGQERWQRGGMHERWEAGQVEYRVGEMTDRWNTGQKRCSSGLMQGYTINFERKNSKLFLRKIIFYETSIFFKL